MQPQHATNHLTWAHADPASSFHQPMAAQRPGESGELVGRIEDRLSMLERMWQSQATSPAMVVPVPVHPHDDPALMNASETFWATRAMSNAFESWTTKKEEPPACMEHKGPLESEAMKRLVAEMGNEHSWMQHNASHQYQLCEALEEMEAALMDSTQRLTMERERNLRVGAQLQESQSQLQQADQTLHDARAQAAAEQAALQQKLAAASEQELEQQQLLRQLAAELEAAVQQNQALSNSSRQLLDAEQSSSSAASQLQQQLHDALAKLATCNGHLQQSQQVEQQLQQQLQQTELQHREATTAQQAKYDELERQLVQERIAAQDMRSQMAASHEWGSHNLQVELVSSQASAAKLEQQQQQAQQALKDEMDKLKLQLNEAHQTAYDHKQREAALEEQIRSEKEKSQQSSEQAGALNKQVSAQVGDLAHKNASVEMLENQLKGTQQECEASKAALSKQMEATSSIERELFAARETARAMSECAQDLERKHSDAEKRAQQANDSLRATEQQRDMLRDRPSLDPALAAKQEQMDEALERLATIERQLIERQQLERMQQDAASKLTQQQSQMQLNHSISTIQQRINNLSATTAAVAASQAHAVIPNDLSHMVNMTSLAAQRPLDPSHYLGFNQLDVNGDGVIDRTEWNKRMQHQMRPPAMEDVAAAQAHRIIQENINRSAAAPVGLDYTGVPQRTDFVAAPVDAWVPSNAAVQAELDKLRRNLAMQPPMMH